MMARQYLSCQASESSVERLFSGTGRSCEGLRNQISPANIDNLVVVKDAMRVIKKRKRKIEEVDSIV